MVVEAAAGTGKTTELVGRIVRLVENDRAPIDRIVAVTFSEKAAGELKLRLREELERARARHAADSPEAARLAAAVHDFEDAHVSTIHGFCQRVLSEQAFASGRLFGEQQVDSREAFGAAFREVLRGQLAREPGLQGILQQWLAEAGA